jgi:diaminopimelate epimerase
MLIPFSKMHALGNDFIILNQLVQPHPITPQLIRQLADRKTGIGCDQVLVIKPPLHADNDFFFRIYNTNGSEAEHCGNGARCFAYHVFEQRFIQKKVIRLETLQGVVIVHLPEKAYDHNIRVHMNKPSFHPDSLPTTAKMNAVGLAHITVLQREHSFRLLSLGNPHCVIRSNDIATIKLDRLGQALNTHPAFPKGINVVCMQIINETDIHVRVYERGVGETQACGSGACAAVVSGILSRRLNATVEVHLPGGSLWVEWPDREADITLIGPVTAVAHGQFALHTSPRS